MKIALFGATGNIGSRILHEALMRGHEVTSIARDPKRLAFVDPEGEGISVTPTGDLRFVCCMRTGRFLEEHASLTICSEL